MSGPYVEPNAREHELSWELIEEIAQCAEGQVEGQLPKAIAKVLARYRVELQRGFAENSRFTTERLQELERKLAAGQKP